MPEQTGRSLADALVAADREFVHADLPAGRLDIGDTGTAGELEKTFLGYQLHPDE